MSIEAIIIERAAKLAYEAHICEQWDCAIEATKAEWLERAREEVVGDLFSDQCFRVFEVARNGEIDISDHGLNNGFPTIHDATEAADAFIVNDEEATEAVIYQVVRFPAKRLRKLISAVEVPIKS